METFTATVRKIGTSKGILIPNEILKHEKISAGEKIKIAIIKTDPKLIDNMMGSAPNAGPFKRDRRDRVF